MINVILDTNIYRSNPLKGDAHFDALTRLSKANILKLHIPYIVEREYQTQEREIYAKNIKDVLSGLAGLARKPLSSQFSKLVAEITAQMEGVKAQILEDAEKQIVQWAIDINANRQPLCIDQATDAMEAYFKGSPPLKQLKVRSDIPDSFLVQAINQICKQTGSAYVVAEDAKIRQAFQNNRKVYVFKNLKSFIESEIIQNELKHIDAYVNNIETINADVMQSERESSVLKRAVFSGIGERVFQEIVPDRAIPSHDGTAIITGCTAVNDVNLDLGIVLYLGAGIFGVIYEANLDVSVVYDISKSDYYNMSPPPNVIEDNGHSVMVEDMFNISPGGMVTFSMKGNQIDGKSIDIGSLNSIYYVSRC